MVPACIVNEPQRTGHLYDIVTKQPISGVTMRRVVSYDATVIAMDSARDFVHAYDKHLTTARDGAYSFPRVVRLKLFWGGRVEDQIDIGGPPTSILYFMAVYRSENWTPSLFLVPLVTVRAQCRDNAECIEQNERFARECYYHPSEPLCVNHVNTGSSRFFDNADDYAGCNGLTERDAIRCVMAGRSRRAVPDRGSCSRLESELARNFCYLSGVHLNWFIGRPNEGCDHISEKKIPDEWLDSENLFISKAEIRTHGLDSFKAICLKLTERPRV
jgi:hypothetical protein